MLCASVCLYVCAHVYAFACVCVHERVRFCVLVASPYLLPTEWLQTPHTFGVRPDSREGRSGKCWARQHAACSLHVQAADVLHGGGRVLRIRHLLHHVLQTGKEKTNGSLP